MIKNNHQEDSSLEREETSNQSEYSEKQEKSSENTKECCSKKDEKDWQSLYFQLSADLDNLKKRAAKDYQMQRESLYKSVMKDLLKVIDDFDRAEEEGKKEVKAGVLPDSFMKGISMIKGSLHDVLKKYGVAEMKENKEFDPLYHEALVHVEDKNHETGSIVSVLRKGYLFHDKVLRPAQVSVAK